VPVGKGAEGFDLSPDGRELWVANAQDGTVSVIDHAAKKVTATLPANAKSVNRLKFTLDGRYVLLSLLGAPDLVILDAKTHAEVKRLPIGHGAAGIQMEPGGGRAFVACTPDNYVAIIDLKTMTVAGHIDVGGEPDGMDWATRP
jgi:YVTN family beta-propeller protein